MPLVRCVHSDPGRCDMYLRFNELDSKARSKLISKADCVRVVDSARKKDLYSWNKGEASICFVTTVRPLRASRSSIHRRFGGRMRRGKGSRPATQRQRVVDGSGARANSRRRHWQSALNSTLANGGYERGALAGNALQTRVSSTAVVLGASSGPRRCTSARR